MSINKRFIHCACSRCSMCDCFSLGAVSVDFSVLIIFPWLGLR